MKKFKKILTFTIVLIVITSILTCCRMESISTIANITTIRPVKVGVLMYSDNVFSVVIANSLKDIQKEKGNEAEITVFDSKANSAMEGEILNSMLDDNYDLLLVNIEGKTVPELIEDSVKKAEQKNISLIFFNVNPEKLDVIRSYSKSLIINNDSKEAGILQGKMIVDAWNTNKNTMDKNGDKIMQYIMIEGAVKNFAAEDRTKYSISTINDAGIKTQELASVPANWDQELAKSAIESLFLRYSGNIEVIISNNDVMAIGAVQGLQKYGYNMGDKTKTIPIFAINRRPETEDLIKKGFIAGSVPRNSRAFADALYTVGMNLVSGKNPLEGTNYKFDESGVIITIQF